MNLRYRNHILFWQKMRFPISNLKTARNEYQEFIKLQSGNSFKAAISYLNLAQIVSGNEQLYDEGTGYLNLLLKDYPDQIEICLKALLLLSGYHYAHGEIFRCLDDLNRYITLVKKNREISITPETWHPRI